MSRKPWKNRMRFLQIFGECRLSQLHVETVVLAATSSLWVGCWFGGRAGEPTGWISGSGIRPRNAMMKDQWSVMECIQCILIIYFHIMSLYIFDHICTISTCFSSKFWLHGIWDWVSCMLLYSFMLLWFLDSGAGGTQLVQRFSA